MSRRYYLAYRLSEVGRLYRLLDVVREGCPEHDPKHLLVALVASATGIGFQWDPTCLAGCAQACRFEQSCWAGAALQICDS